MPDDAHNERIVALNSQVFHGVLDRPKKDQVTTVLLSCPTVIECMGKVTEVSR